MSSTTRRLGRVLGLLAAVSIAVSACGGPAAPSMTDPKEIVTAALRTSEGARSVHVEATLDGHMNVDLSGTGAPGANVPLTGTAASADVDIAAGNAHATFFAFGLDGELIQIGDTSYYKTPLTGDQYQTQKAGDLLPVNPGDTKSLVGKVGDLLSKDGVNPVKGDDVACGSTQCYTVKVELTSDQLNALDGGEPVPSGLPIDLSAAGVSLTLRVEKDSDRLAGIAATIALGDQGSLSIDLAFSKWDEPVSVSAPPADQVQSGS